MKVTNKFNMKHFSHAHVHKDGKVELFYRKQDKDSGKEIDWSEMFEGEWSFSIRSMAEAHGFDYICFHPPIAKLLRHATLLQFYSKNYYNDSKIAKAGFNAALFVLFLSDGSEVHETYVYETVSGSSITSCNISKCEIWKG